MHVLLTGAFGNIGSSTLRQLLQDGHTVRCFVRRSKRNEQFARKFAGKIELAWGDICQPDDAAAAMRDQEVIIHLAAIIPPQSEEDPATAYRTNVEGTRVLLEVAKRQESPPSILFSSTFDLFGFTQDQPPPRRVSDPLQATNEYTKHKLACEEMITASGLTWSIYRFSDVPPLAPRKPHPIMYSIPLSTRIEILHTYDAALAIANGLRSAIWGKVWLIGGGKSCQIYYREYLRRQMEDSGVGMLPEEAFGTLPFCCDWIDTEESQQLLQYQHHSFEDITSELARINKPEGIASMLMPLMRPLIRKYLLSMSPHLKSKSVSGEQVIK